MEKEMALKELLSVNFDKPAKAIVPQDSNHKFRINLVAAATDVSKIGLVNKCKPRTSLDGKTQLFEVLPPRLVNSFEDTDKKMVDWLSRSQENVHEYLSDPVSALKKAGVELERADQKTIHRNFENFQAENLLSPGMNLQNLTGLFRKGKITKVSTHVEDKDNPCDCGCK